MGRCRSLTGCPFAGSHGQKLSRSANYVALMRSSYPGSGGHASGEGGGQGGGRGGNGGL